MSDQAPSGPAAPVSVNKLRGAIDAVAKNRNATVRRIQSLVGNVIVAQMLPDSAVKGGTGMKLRFGDEVTRETPDLDTAFRGEREDFISELNQRLAEGWGDFTGVAVAGEQRAPEELLERIPHSYVMQPVRVRLEYHGKGFMSVDLEIGYDELEATTDEPPETEMSEEVLEIFAALGMPRPDPVRVLPLHHQISQKIHACTERGSSRAHDLVDLQLLIPTADPDQVRDTCERLFRFRQSHEWPPTLEAGLDWPALYEEAAEGLDVRGLDEAVVWVNEYIHQLATEQ
ncbi:nucleotidyl transferase AbiEii/AbiGii toxin family protein [Nocardioides sp. zg-1228]|uniref:nucleotidyl transferase AbiEii/AbiGii toxin family protein n=1 Tax=Nocardioides sp. zg-1228 TaxID=2763008 RepID=UPI0016432AA6|nr:nucleotidyl transferase AbiEii/AbiGii toxin family protein [Nocardioides sp. zg-1228]MBC2932936.1 nucleotidyl transferase AbiEii/AbiGii toxin family protein [Nocardioides sp. zg-1228]QSF56863.1 nucleotidyl transferase AbiEii/AbiGii toxin family protein [Nocardioides sp. zg-1228]